MTPLPPRDFYQGPGRASRAVLDLIDGFRDGHVPLIVPVTLLDHFVRKHDEPYLKEQVYLRPHPIELKLRNHA